MLAPVSATSPYENLLTLTCLNANCSRFHVISGMASLSTVEWVLVSVIFDEYSSL